MTTIPEAFSSCVEDFQILFDNASDAIFIADPTAKLLAANTSACQALGYSHAELMDLTLTQIDIPEEAEEITARMSQLMEHGILSFTTQHRRKDGTTIPIEVNSRRIIWQGQAAVLSICRDVSDRLRIEASLRKNQLQLQTVISNLKGICFTVDPQGIFTFSDGQALSLLGQIPGQVVGLSCYEVYKQDPDVITGIKYALSGDSWRGCNVAAGIAFETIISPLRDDQGKIYGATGVATDISARLEIEAALRDSRDLFEGILASLQDAVYLVDPTTDRLSIFNEATLALFGYSREELLALHVEYLHPNAAHFQQFRQDLRDASEGSGNFSLETELQRKSGEIFSCEISGRLVRDSSGRIRSIVSVVHDLTDRKRSEVERAKLAERLGQTQKLEALGVLVAGVADNMNNVLAAIMGTASWRQELTPSAAEAEAYKIIETACKRGRDVIKSLLQFASPSLSDLIPIELNSLILEVRVLLESTTRNRIKILDTLHADPLWTRGDAGSISSALMNLCLNSLDAMPNGGTLLLGTVALEPGWIEVSVIDDGEGIDPEVLPRITEPFFTTKPAGTGTGLGLSMTHGAIKAHGGTMSIHSLPGHGTTVTLRLPRIEAPRVTPTITSKSPGGGPLRILVVDDDPDVLYLTSRMLQTAGHQVVAVDSGQSALNQLEITPDFSVILMDQNMPGLTGIQTISKIRLRGITTPIMIISGQPDIQQWDCCHQPNVIALCKPFSMAELLSKLPLLSGSP